MVCYGGGCSVTFSNVSIRCTLVVLNGAHATLTNPCFSQVITKREGVALCKRRRHGGESGGGQHHWGAHGVHVGDGAHLKASQLTVTTVGVTGSEVTGSTVELTDCTFKDFRPLMLAVKNFTNNGVDVTHRGTVTLTRTVVSAVERGVRVVRASPTLTDCTIKGCGEGGLDGYGQGSVTVLEHCILQKNGGSGVGAQDGAKLTARQCKSSSHAWGFLVHACQVIWMLVANSHTFPFSSASIAAAGASTSLLLIECTRGKAASCSGTLSSFSGKLCSCSGKLQTS